MALAPDSRGCYEDEARNSHAQQVVTREQGDIGEGALRRLWCAGRCGRVVVEDEREGVRGEEGREGGCDDGAEAEDGGDEVATPERVVERVCWFSRCKYMYCLLAPPQAGGGHTVRVVGWLRHQDGSVGASLQLFAICLLSEC